MNRRFASWSQASVICLLLLSGCAPTPSGQSSGAPPAIGNAGENDAPPADVAGTVPSEEPRVSPVLRMHSVPGPEARASALADLQRAMVLQRSGDSQGALRLLDRVRNDIPAFADWADLLVAEVTATTGDTVTVRQRLALVEPVRVREWGWQARDRALLAAGDTLAAMQALESATAEISDSQRLASALRGLGDLRHAQGDLRGALDAYRGAMEAAPASPAGREASAALSGLPLLPRDRLLEGRVWLRHGNVERGRLAIEAYLAAGEATPAVRAGTQLLLGRALFNARRYPDAERHLLAASRASGAAGSVAAEASLLAGRSQFRAGRETQARSTLAATADRFPGEVAAVQALFILGDLDQNAGRSSSARGHFRRAATLGVESADAALAAIRWAGSMMMEGNPHLAANFLDEFSSGQTNNRLSAQARYWAGRAHLAAGDATTARLRFSQARMADPISYYGKLATVRLGGSLKDLELAPSPIIEPATGRAVEVALFRVDLLRDLGRNELADFELERARAELETWPGALYLIAEAHLQRGAPVSGILLGREIQRREGTWNPRLLRIVYPFPHRALIEAEARRHRLDPFMVAGLIRQESMFNPIAVSPAGAVGLMQVMPATGRSLARRAGIARFDPAMLRRPEVNVRLGTLFLADLLSRNRNQTHAFAAYNAGPSRLAAWRAFPEVRDEELFAERIPFAETRDYVKILNFNAQLYRLLYAE